MTSEGSGKTPQVATTDIALTAFYLVNGLELIDVRKAHAVNSLDCEFVLRDPDEIAEKLRIQWASSPEHRYDSQLRALRKIITEQRRSRGRKRRASGRA